MSHMKSERGSPEEISDDSGGRSSSQLACLVCGDVATGRHYGAIACNGCKGFFRRTIRRAYKYTCRFAGGCQIDKHNRAVCRACRFNRCLKFGMKVDAVQNERDLIGKRPRAPSNSYAQVQNSANGTVSSPQSTGTASVSPINNVVGSMPTSHFFGLETSVSSMAIDSTSVNSSKQSSSSTSCGPWDDPKLLMDLLMESEKTMIDLRESVVRETGKREFTVEKEPDTIKVNGRKASYNDILHSLYSQLLLVIEWAKTLAPFSELRPTDQFALLKNFASQHIVLCVAYRSINAPGFLQLINDSCIPRVNTSGDGEDDFYRKDCERVMDQLVGPMQYLKIDYQEFIALKACVLFNPVARGLSTDNVMKVLDTRRRLFSALEHYVRAKNPADTHRLGDLTFFVLSPLQSLAKSVSEDVLVTKLTGLARFDVLIEELILDNAEPKAHKNGIDVQQSMVHNEQVPAHTSNATSHENLTELRTMQVPANGAQPLVIASMPEGALAQYSFDPSMPTTSATNELSPIHDYEMTSTLSSYVFGTTLQSPLSPSSDVLFSSTTTLPISTGMYGKFSNCSAGIESVSSCQNHWSNPSPVHRLYECVPYTPSVSTPNPALLYPAPTIPLNY